MGELNTGFAEYCKKNQYSLNQTRSQAFQLGVRSQQSKIEQLEKKLKAVEEIMNDYYTGSFEESPEMAGLISLALSGECDE